MADEKENKTERVHLLMSPSELQAIDDWGFANRIRTRGAAIRLLASQGLAADATAKALTAANALISELLDGQVNEATILKWADALGKSDKVAGKALQSRLDVLRNKQ